MCAVRKFQITIVRAFSEFLDTISTSPAVAATSVLQEVGGNNYRVDLAMKVYRETGNIRLIVKYEMSPIDQLINDINLFVSLSGISSPLTSHFERKIYVQKEQALYLVYQEWNVRTLKLEYEFKSEIPGTRVWVDANMGKPIYKDRIENPSVLRGYDFIVNTNTKRFRKDLNVIIKSKVPGAIGLPAGSPL